MKRLAGFALLIAAVWMALEIYTEGFDGAFGGAVAEKSSSPVNRSKRAAGAFQRFYDSSENRLEDALESDG